MSHAIVTDLSPEGLCIERPFGHQQGRTIPIEFEIPEVDEVVWAVGEVRFDEVKRPSLRKRAGLGGLVRHTGLRLTNLAERHRKILREYVMDTCHSSLNQEAIREESQQPEPAHWLMAASCYR